MASELAGKTAIVTGGSRGIGAAISRALAAAGANVVVAYKSNGAEAEKVVGEIVKSAGKAIAVRADISQPAAAKTVFDAAENQFRRVHILVHSAGAILYKNFADATDAEFDELMKLNVYGTFYLLRAAATRIADRGSGDHLQFVNDAHASADVRAVRGDEGRSRADDAYRR